MSSVAIPFLGRTELESASNTIARPRVAEKRNADPLAHLVAGCRRREPAAQRELVSRTQERVYRTLFRLVGPQDAEDVSQLVFLQVFRQIDRFNGDSFFSTWLYRITVNEAMQHLRRRSSRKLKTLSTDPADYRSDRCQQSEVREVLDRALQQIDAELRSIFVLREVENLSYQEIGAALNLPAGTVASRLSRARHDLQARLRSLGWNG